VFKTGEIRSAAMALDLMYRPLNIQDVQKTVYTRIGSERGIQKQEERIYFTLERIYLENFFYAKVRKIEILKDLRKPDIEFYLLKR